MVSSQLILFYHFQVCGVCMDTLEEYWDEELEEWRYKNAIRKESKVCLLQLLYLCVFVIYGMFQ